MANLKKKYPANKKIVDQSKKLVADWKASCIPASGVTPEKPQNGKTPTKKEPEEKKETKREEPLVDKKRKLSSMLVLYVRVMCLVHIVVPLLV